MINWKNTTENLGLILITGIVFGSLGLFGGFKISVQTAENMLEQQKSIIELAIKKETTAITNSVTTQIDKIKSKKSEPINIVIDPQTNSVISDRDTTQVITVEKKKGFFKRLFKKRKNENK
jgi:hypothetical protein